MSTLVDRLCGIYGCEPLLLLEHLWTEDCIKFLRTLRYRTLPPAGFNGVMRYHGITYKSAERELVISSTKTTVAEEYAFKKGHSLMHAYLPCMLEYLPETNTVNKIPLELIMIVE
jgi:hypothetical protein